MAHIPPAPLLALLLLTACDGATDCTLIGCMDTLTLHVTGAPTGAVYGVVTVDGHDFQVDCAGESDPDVLCDGSDITFQLPNDVVGGGEVTWTLSTPDDDTATGGGSYVGNGTFTPDWTSSTPNGPDCGPTCWTGDGAVELQGTP